MQYFTTVRKRRRGGRREWMARLIYKDEVTGLRKEKSKSAQSQSEAKRMEKELEDDFLAGGQTTVESDEMTFEELAKHCQETKYCAAEYDEEGRKLFGVRDTTVYDAHFKHFKSFFGKMKIRDIKVVHLRAYRNDRLRTKTKRGTQVNVATVDRELSTLRAVFNEARICEWLIVNPFSKARQGELITTAEEESRERILTAAEERRLLKACEGDNRRHLLSLVIAALDTGARLGELLRLTWGKVSFDDGVIKDLISYKGKGGKILRRDAPVTIRLKRTLLDLQREKPIKAFRRLKSGLMPEESLVFGISHNVRKSWYGARKDSGLLDVRFHDLRHTAATRLAESMQLGIVGKVLGHSNPKTTSRYVNPDRAIILEAGRVLDRWQEKNNLIAGQDELVNQSEAVN